MAKVNIPEYGKVENNGKTYYRVRLRDADGKQVAVYGKTPEELMKKEKEAKRAIDDAIFRRNNPTVKDYCEKWLLMKSATVKPSTIKGYKHFLDKYVIEPIGEMYMDEVTADDLRILMVPVSKKTSNAYSKLNMLIKCIFYSAEDSRVIGENPSANLNPRGGTKMKKREPLTDEQVKILVDTAKDIPPHLLVMLGLYAGLRREESLALQWDCVHLDGKTPFISVRRAWHGDTNPPTITTELKTPASKRDIPIPKCLAECLRAEKEKSNSDFVISDSNGEPLSYPQFARVWNYLKVRSVGERTVRVTRGGRTIKHTINPQLGERTCKSSNVFVTMDFQVTTHQLRHTYITNLIYQGVDPKTVQYLAGHKNSKVTMDIYAKVKYNKPEQLLSVVNAAFGQGEQKEE